MQLSPKKSPEDTTQPPVPMVEVSAAEHSNNNQDEENVNIVVEDK